MPSEANSPSTTGNAVRPLSIAIAALGGQGGGVLAEWLVSVAELHGWSAQSTSVPGVAQRTGTTVYYLELCPPVPAGARKPVMALMPVPGDVDVVVAAELMEAGRTVVRGLVTPGRTTLVASSHRVYGITEKSAMGNGIADANAVLAALHSQSRRLVCFDMDVVAEDNKSVISSVLFGAVAGSAALPFPRALYEKAIRDSGVAVKSNLAGFAAGFERALQTTAVVGIVPPAGAPTTASGRELDEQVKREFPAHLHGLIVEGVKRLLDYQDADHARLYLERLRAVRDCDKEVSAGHEYALTAAVARYLALWMSYEDTIRVADLKTRGARFTRFRNEVRAASDQIVYVAEFMHPRFDEVCETLPAGLGAWLLGSAGARKMMSPLFKKGRQIQTARLRGFLMLRMVAGMRRWRRSTLRYRLEEQRIATWLARVQAVASQPGRYDVALEIAECQRLVKGYSDTHERGLRNYHTLMRIADASAQRADLADVLKRLRNAALADEEGRKLAATLAELGLAAV